MPKPDLYLQFALTLSNQSGAATFHAQAYIPTQPAQAVQDSRISHAHEDPGRQEGDFPPARQGAQTGLGETRFPRIVQWREPERPRTRCCARGLHSSGNSDLELRVTVTVSVPENESGESNHDVLPRGSREEVAARSGKGAFPRSARLLRHADFERVYKLGRRHFSASMTVFYWQRADAGMAEAQAAAAKSPELRDFASDSP